MNFVRNLYLITLLLMTTAGYMQSQDIHATVDGNNVTLWETGAERNCGAVYEMAITPNDHHIKWIQHDTGMLAVCLCIFDLSVTYGPLEAGDYTVDVYYTGPDEPDEFFEGSTGFTIGVERNTRDGIIISQYQSDCGTGIDDPESGEDFRIYPVPLADGEILNVEAQSSETKTILEIFTLTGKQIFSKQYNSNRQIRDIFIKDELFPIAGIYVVRLRNDDQIFVRKITVL